jgi:Tetrapyrrole (Corrin/Porphyrin) Methylases
LFFIFVKQTMVGIISSVVVLLLWPVRLTLATSGRNNPSLVRLAFVTPSDRRRIFADKKQKQSLLLSVQQRRSSNGAARRIQALNNDWGIPDSATLEPLSPIVLKELPNGGRITLMGSGPGDPELLTLSAYRLLRDPDVMVIADRLVSDEILDLIATEDLKVARKMPGCADLAQEEIYWWAHEGMKQGKHVVRLKIGDPFVFGRGGEEVLKFRKFGVEANVIPVSRWICILVRVVALSYL